MPITGDLGLNDGRDSAGSERVNVYVPTYPVQKPQGKIVIGLPIIGQEIVGRVGDTPSR
jgi:hypothetical protein